MTQTITAAQYRGHRMVMTPLDGDPVEFGALMLSSVPPSLNNLFVNGKKGRFKSPDYKAWQARAYDELRRQNGWHVAGKIRVRLTFNRAKSRADLDNLQKPTLDLLMAAGRIADDRNVIELHSAFGAVPGTMIEIWCDARRIANSEPCTPDMPTRKRHAELGKAFA